MHMQDMYSPMKTTNTVGAVLTLSQHRVIDCFWKMQGLLRTMLDKHKAAGTQRVQLAENQRANAAAVQLMRHALATKKQYST